MGATYYKATRPDGTAFCGGQVKYEVGKTSKPLAHEGPRVICGPGLLHAADAPGETLIGGFWPCRLFEVTGKPVQGFDARHAHKGGFLTLKVVQEIDPYLALGPNGRYVAGIIERTRSLTYAEALEIRAAGGAAWNAAWGAAWNAAWGAARGAAWGAARGAAWGAARDAAGDAAWNAAWNAAGDAAWGAAWNAAWGAALAVLNKDLITPEQFKTLYGPWEKVCGKPKMAPKWKGAR